MARAKDKPLKAKGKSVKEIKKELDELAALLSEKKALLNKQLRERDMRRKMIIGAFVMSDNDVCKHFLASMLSSKVFDQFVSSKDKDLFWPSIIDDIDEDVDFEQEDDEEEEEDDDEQSDIDDDVNFDEEEDDLGEEAIIDETPVRRYVE
ncbi:hypothetical protein FACS1894167_09210 [Synergistales bacterium]|nr:hypothetical protein FACS1894167_09210 [Synergistales bacterium]